MQDECAHDFSLNETIVNGNGDGKLNSVRISWASNSRFGYRSWAPNPESGCQMPEHSDGLVTDPHNVVLKRHNYFGLPLAWGWWGEI